MNPKTTADSSAKTNNPSGEASPPVTGYACAPGAIALLEMRYWLAMIEHENLAAGREEALGGWLCDHSGAVNHYAVQFDEAKNRAQAQTHIGALTNGGGAQ